MSIIVFLLNYLEMSKKKMRHRSYNQLVCRKLEDSSYTSLLKRPQEYMQRPCVT